MSGPDRLDAGGIGVGNPKGLRASVAEWCGDTHICTHDAVVVLPTEALAAYTTSEVVQAQKDRTGIPQYCHE